MVEIAIAWLGLSLVCLILLVWELRNIKPCPPDCIDCSGVGVDLRPGAVNRVCNEHLMERIHGEFIEVEALKEIGAGDAYMQRVKEQLCGPFGKLMP